MRRKPIRLLVLGAGDSGGVRGYVDSIVSGCRTDRIEWHIAVPGRTTAVVDRDPGVVTWHRCPVDGGLWALAKCVARARRLIIGNEIDVLHLHTARAGFVGCLASIGLGIGIVYTGHGWQFHHRKSGVGSSGYRIMERWICARASVVAVEGARNERIAQEAGLAPAGKLVVISTRIDADPLEGVEKRAIDDVRIRYGISPSGPVIGMIGMLERRKDPYTFVRTAARVVRIRPDARFLWVGGGELLEETLELARDLGLGAKLVVTGVRPSSELPALFQVMTLLLFTSRHESFPLSVLGAQGAGRPVVVSGYCGVEEIVSDGRSGLVFPPGDDERASECVLRVITDEASTKRMVENARADFVTKHSNPAIMAQEYEREYEKAMSDVG